MQCNELRDLPASLSTSSPYSRPPDPKEGAWPEAQVYLRTNDAATGDETSLCGSDSVSEVLLQGELPGDGGATASPSLVPTPPLGLWGWRESSSTAYGSRLPFVLYYKRLKQNPP